VHLGEVYLFCHFAFFFDENLSFCLIDDAKVILFEREKEE